MNDAPRPSGNFDQPATPATDAATMAARTRAAAPGDALRRGLTVLAAVLAFGVVGLGAFVRLSDAGLGCPDWPGCYGHYLGVPDSAPEHAAAALAFPGQSVDSGRAWKEMVHRYAAGSLGLLVATLFVLAWRRRGGRWPVFEGGLLALVCAQALLGMWTVTLLLKPVIVTAHLLGGMLTWALLAGRALELVHGSPPPTAHAVSVAPAPTAAPGAPASRTAAAQRARRRLGGLALGLLLLQIALGGWVASNYAALACPDLPTCQGRWWPAGDWGRGFQLLRELGSSADAPPLPVDALIAIHWAHRLGALAVLAVGGLLAWRLASTPGLQRHGQLLAVLLLGQLGLGLANVALQLPLPIAVGHNLGAALLLATLVNTMRRLRPALPARDATLPPASAPSSPPAHGGPTARPQPRLQ